MIQLTLLLAAILLQFGAIVFAGVFGVTVERDNPQYASLFLAFLFSAAALLVAAAKGRLEGS